MAFYKKNVCEYFEKIEEKHYMCDVCYEILDEENCLEHEEIHNICNFLIYECNILYKCKTCEKFEYELDLGAHLLNAHGIANEDFLKNLTDVFFDLKEYSLSKFGSLVCLNKCYYDCLICNKKLFRHVGRHFSRNHKDIVPNEKNFYKTKKIKYYKCLFCRDNFLEKDFYNHFKLIHDIKSDVYSFIKFKL